MKLRTIQYSIDKGNILAEIFGNKYSNWYWHDEVKGKVKDKQWVFFPNRAELSLNSGNLINHWSINWVQFKDPVSHTCLAGLLVASVKHLEKNSNIFFSIVYCLNVCWSFSEVQTRDRAKYLLKNLKLKKKTHQTWK